MSAESGQAHTAGAPPAAPPRVVNAAPVPVTVLRARKGWRLPDLAEVWRYRELFWVLALRDIKIRYKQTALGVAWAIVQPLTTMFVFSTLARVGKISTEGVRPEVFYYSGMLPWLFFANAFTSAGNSLLGSQHLITKVYFPRMIVPAASVITAMIDFGVAFLGLLVVMLLFRVWPGPRMLLVPVFMLLGILTALAFGLGLSALSVQFRDVRHMAPFLTQIWFFCTPVLYPSSAVGAGWKRVLLGMNPMAGVVEGVRWCVLGRPAPGPTALLSALVTLAVLIAALLYFRSAERTFADRL
jgi:lipopolysaccharide transport system permease protein